MKKANKDWKGTFLLFCRFEKRKRCEESLRGWKTGREILTAQREDDREDKDRTKRRKKMKTKWQKRRRMKMKVKRRKREGRRGKRNTAKRIETLRWRR